MFGEWVPPNDFIYSNFIFQNLHDSPNEAPWAIIMIYVCVFVRVCMYVCPQSDDTKSFEILTCVTDMYYLFEFLVKVS